MPLHSTGFPSCSKLIDKKWEERRMKLHAQRVHGVQSSLNTAPPKVYPHMVLRLKKIQNEELKQAEIDRDNQNLLQRMTWILKQKGQVDNWNDYRQMSMNQMIREREQRGIAEKNLLIARKLESVKPYYCANEWEEEYEKRAYLQGLWNQSAKDFGQTSPRGSMASKRGNSYEHLPSLDKKEARGSQKAKSESTASSVTKLPKILNNGSTKYPRDYYQRQNRDHAEPSSHGSDIEGNDTCSYTTESSKPSSKSSSNAEALQVTRKAKEKRSTMPAAHQDVKGAHSEGKKKKVMKPDANKSKKAKEVRPRLPDPDTEGTEESSDESDNSNGEEVFDVERKHSVKRSRRTGSHRQDSALRVEDHVQEKDADDDTAGECAKTDIGGYEVGGSGDSADESVDLSPEALQTPEPDEQCLDEESTAEQDAKHLFRAVKKLVKPEDAVVKTLIRRSPKQRILTKTKFEETYEMNLGSELKKVLGSAHSTLVDCLLGLNSKRDTMEIHNALKATDVAKLVEIISKRGSNGMDAINMGYKKDYDISLEEDIAARISDQDCRNLLTALLQDRPESERVNEDLAAQEAEELQEAGEGRFSNENGRFIRLIKERSPAQLRATFTAYKQLSGGNDITELLEEDGCSKDFVIAVGALDASTNQTSGQWAEKIHNQLKPNNAELITMMLDRSDHEMTAIRKAYRKKYCGELTDDINAKCGKESGPLIAHIAARGGVTPPGKQPRPPLGEKPKRVNGVVVPSPPRRPQLKGFEPRTPEFGKDNPFQEPQKRPIGEHIRQEAKDKLDGRGAQAKTGKSEKDTRKKVPKAPPPRGNKNYNAEEDVRKVREAMKNWGTDEEQLIRVLVSRPNVQRQQIRKKYKEKYKSDLLEDLKSELGGELEEALVAFMMEPTEYDAYCLHDAMEGFGTNEAVLIGILTTRSAKEIKSISGQYMKMYGKSLEEALTDDTSGSFSELLATLVSGERDQGSSIDQKLVEQDAKQLYEGTEGGGRLNPNDEVFKNVMTKRNKQHTRAVFEHYKKLSWRPLEETIKDSFGGDAEEAYLGLAQAIQSPTDFYVRRLHSAMVGTGTNDQMLIRILVSRSEVDLATLKSTYKATYGTSLEDAIDSECSGDYKKFLLALLKDIEKTKGKQRQPVRQRMTLRERRSSPERPKVSTQPNETKQPAKTKPSQRTHLNVVIPGTKIQRKTTTSSPKLQRDTERAKTKGRQISEAPVRGTSIKMQQGSRTSNEPSTSGREGQRHASQNRTDGRAGTGISRRDSAVRKGETEEGKDSNEKDEQRNMVPRPPTPTHGTVMKALDWSVEDDIITIENTIKNWNNDEETIMSLLHKRSSEQRMALRDGYGKKHSKDLLAVLRSKLRGDFEKVVIAMMSHSHELITSVLHQSLDCVGDDNCLINALFATGSSQDISTVMEKYEREYKVSFIDDVKENEADPSYVKILKELVSGSRDQSYLVDEIRAKEDATKMYDDGNYSLKLRDDTLASLLTKANRSQFKATCNEFKIIAGEDIVEGIKWAMIGECEDAVLGLVNCLRDPVTYFAEHLDEAMKGLGTNDDKLISIIVSRSEIDLVNIRTKYQELYGRDLADAIRRECRGDSAKTLLTILSGDLDKCEKSEEVQAEADNIAALLLNGPAEFPSSNDRRASANEGNDSGRHTILSNTQYRSSSAVNRTTEKPGDETRVESEQVEPQTQTVEKVRKINDNAVPLTGDDKDEALEGIEISATAEVLETEDQLEKMKDTSAPKKVHHHKIQPDETDSSEHRANTDTLHQQDLLSDPPRGKIPHQKENESTFIVSDRQDILNTDTGPQESQNIEAEIIRDQKEKDPSANNKATMNFEAPSTATSVGLNTVSTMKSVTTPKAKDEPLSTKDGADTADIAKIKPQLLDSISTEDLKDKTAGTYPKEHEELLIKEETDNLQPGVIRRDSPEYNTIGQLQEPVVEDRDRIGPGTNSDTTPEVNSRKQVQDPTQEHGDGLPHGANTASTPDSNPKEQAEEPILEDRDSVQPGTTPRNTPENISKEQAGELIQKDRNNIDAGVTLANTPDVTQAKGIEYGEELVREGKMIKEETENRYPDHGESRPPEHLEISLDRTRDSGEDTDGEGKLQSKTVNHQPDAQDEDVTDREVTPEEKPQDLSERRGAEKKTRDVKVEDEKSELVLEEKGQTLEKKKGGKHFSEFGDDLMGMILGSVPTEADDGNMLSEGKDEGIGVEECQDEECQDEEHIPQNEEEEGGPEAERASLKAEEAVPGDNKDVGGAVTIDTWTATAIRANNKKEDAAGIATDTSVDVRDTLRPRDPMCSDKQEEMERKSRTTVRFDTVDNFNPDLIRMLNLSPKDPPRALSAEETAESGLQREKRRDATDVIEDDDEGGVVIEEADGASTDDEVTENELYVDDWDPELAAVLGKNPDIPECVFHEQQTEMTQGQENIPEAITNDTKNGKGNHVGPGLMVEITSLETDSGTGNSTVDAASLNGNTLKVTAMDASVVSQDLVHDLVTSIIEKSTAELIQRHNIEEGGTSK